jgi:hypothetical protein
LYAANTRRQSLKTSLTFLSEPTYAPLIEEALRVSLQLIDHLHPPPPTPADLSHARFEALSQLTLAGPLQIYLFASEKPIFAILAADAVLALTKRMGSGMLRHLKDLLGPLLSILTFPLLVVDRRTAPMYIRTCEAVAALLRACPSAQGRWGMLVLTSVAKCWILLKEARVSEGGGALAGEYREALKAVVGVLRDGDAERLEVRRAFRFDRLRRLIKGRRTWLR